MIKTKDKDLVEGHGLTSKDIDWCRRTMIKMKDKDLDEGHGLVSTDKH